MAHPEAGRAVRRVLIAAVAALALGACNSGDVRDVQVDGGGGRKVIRVDGVRMRLVEIQLPDETVHCLVGVTGNEGHVMTCWKI